MERTYKIIYTFNACITQCLVMAASEEEAKRKFRSAKGDFNILDIQDITN